jgi:hypothetical protein
MTESLAMWHRHLAQINRPESGATLVASLRAEPICKLWFDAFVVYGGSNFLDN